MTPFTDQDKWLFCRLLPLFSLSTGMNILLSTVCTCTCLPSVRKPRLLLIPGTWVLKTSKYLFICDFVCGLIQSLASNFVAGTETKVCFAAQKDYSVSFPLYFEQVRVRLSFARVAGVSSLGNHWSFSRWNSFFFRSSPVMS